ncbi:hypothetical protein GH714_011639 [Hevea brasiliensis]|uniref:RING-type domain-containing protein n=1 Tax=Hevea brasiliensis TaxID=3981 RepID=A0A6A6MJW5_HEVBR|nr:hypothetical protein GH714_011639 [Hevea brasiliensis]
MGFPMNMPEYFGFKFLPTPMTYFKIVFTGALTHLRLLKPTEQAYTAEVETTNYVLIIDRLCPTPIPVPVNILTAVIKERLPVTKFSSTLKRLAKDEDEECMCPVCLDSVRNRDEIRELCNCSHVFHKECLDKCVDEGQVTCPYADPCCFQKTSCGSLLINDMIKTESFSEDP